MDVSAPSLHIESTDFTITPILISQDLGHLLIVAKELAEKLKLVDGYRIGR